MEEEQFIDFTKPRQRENGRIKYRRYDLLSPAQRCEAEQLMMYLCNGNWSRNRMCQGWWV